MPRRDLRKHQRLFLFLFQLTSVVAAHAGDDDERERRIRFFGDFRLRLEQDWDSLRGDGTKRDDRLRLRIRLRGGVEAKFSDKWSALVQARSGPNLSQQSPHITIADFDGGPAGPYDFNLDHWYVSYSSGGFDAWAGRNALSFWHQDDLFVFDNVTYAGAGGSCRHTVADGTLSWSLNYVAMPAGMRDFSGTAVVGQVAYEKDFETSGFTAAAGLFASNADPGNAGGNVLLTENNTRDYRVLDVQLQYRARVFGQPTQLGFDVTHNFENYDDAPAGSFSEFHKDHVNGYVAEVLWGKRDAAGDWMLGYYYAYVKALATHSSYIQDDWLRWGDANQVRATNMTGSELRALYTIRSNMNLFARLFFVNAIDLLEPGDTTKETANRFRLDWNISF